VTPGLKALQRSVTAKVVFIGVLILILLIPLGMIEGLSASGSFSTASARDDIARAWGQAQTVGGPILVVPFTYTRDVPDNTFANAERHRNHDQG
jgi:inner membrane protein